MSELGTTKLYNTSFLWEADPIGGWEKNFFTQIIKP